MIQEAV